MKKLALVIALSSVAMASPALARDGTAYIQFDIGAIKPERLSLEYTNSTVTVAKAEELRHKVGLDADIVGGYDLGRFRLEVEAAYKRARINDGGVLPDALFAQGSNFAPAEVPGSFSFDGRTSVGSGMLNGLIDLGDQDGFSGSVGVGVGLARVKTRAGLLPGSAFNFRDADRAMALQALAEVRYAVSPNLDLGLKYRHFRTTTLDFGPFCRTTCTPTFELHGRFRSNSLLASLAYNFYRPAPPPPPPAPPPPPPPPPPPATQTCPDGSVILATSTCPAPPPPPPPPAERGERGR
jgi:OOP family OmpA-OmpF porin